MKKHFFVQKMLIQAAVQLLHRQFQDDGHHAHYHLVDKEE